MNRLFSIGALFSCNWNIAFNQLSDNDEYHIRDLKFSGIKYSKRMWRIPSAVSIHLIKIFELRLKVPKSYITAFNYAIPAPDT